MIEGDRSHSDIQSVGELIRVKLIDVARVMLQLNEVKALLGEDELQRFNDLRKETGRIK